MQYSFHKTVRVTGWLLMAMLLVSCGFHLRGAPELPESFKTVNVSAKSETALVEDLKNLLQTGAVAIVDDAALASSVITIISEKNSERVLSVDNNGRAREYELKYTVEFSVAENNRTSDDGAITTQRVLIDKRQLELVRDFLFDTSAVLGTTREKSGLIRDMQRDASRLIMLQIQAAYRKTDNTDSTKEKK